MTKVMSKLRFHVKVIANGLDAQRCAGIERSGVDIHTSVSAQGSQDSIEYLYGYHLKFPISTSSVDGSVHLVLASSHLLAILHDLGVETTLGDVYTKLAEKIQARRPRLDYTKFTDLLSSLESLDLHLETGGLYSLKDVASLISRIPKDRIIFRSCAESDVKRIG